MISCSRIEDHGFVFISVHQSRAGGWAGGGSVLEDLRSRSSRGVAPAGDGWAALCASAMALASDWGAALSGAPRPRPPPAGGKAPLPAPRAAPAAFQWSDTVRFQSRVFLQMVHCTTRVLNALVLYNRCQCLVFVSHLRHRKRLEETRGMWRKYSCYISVIVHS